MPKYVPQPSPNRTAAHKATPLPQPKDRGVPEVKVTPLALLHGPTAKQEDRIKKRQRHRLTPVAKAFICECILAGCSNGQVNPLLRQKGFILEGEADLSEDTLGRLRGLEECALNPEQLTLEARQVGHNIVSTWMVYWVELGDAAFQRLTTLMEGGEVPEGMSVKEALSIVVKATKFIMATCAAGLPEHIRTDIEAHLGGAGESAVSGAVPLPPTEQMVDYVGAIIAATYERCRADLARKEGIPLEEFPIPPWRAE